MDRVSKGILIAAAAATLLATGAVQARAEEKAGGDVKCLGINSCKGKGSCAGAGNSCAGQNSCKGKGIISVPKAECEKKGGKVIS
jgi:uncharacterized membrane protein